MLLDGETLEQENQPDRVFESVEKKKELAKTSGKGFRRVVADY